MRNLLFLSLTMLFLGLSISYKKQGNLASLPLEKQEVFLPSPKVSIVPAEVTTLRDLSLEKSLGEAYLLNGEDGRTVLITHKDKNEYELLLIGKERSIVARLSASIEGNNIAVTNNANNLLFSGIISGDKLRFTEIATGRLLNESPLRLWRNASTATKICSVGLGVVGVTVAAVSSSVTAGASAYAFAMLYGGLTAMICDGW